MSNLDKIATALFIMQKKQDKQAETHDHDLIRVMARWNPYNPLTYVFYALLLIIVFFYFGFTGIKEVLTSAEGRFKWTQISKRWVKKK